MLRRRKIRKDFLSAAGAEERMSRRNVGSSREVVVAVAIIVIIVIIIIRLIIMCEIEITNTSVM
jgi:hypothetical protein